MYDLTRFLKAQEDSYQTALLEMKAGRKKSHWMWYIFPQIHGLGRSSMAQRYAIRDLAEAKEYIEHPVLGPRLVEISEALLEHEGLDARMIMGQPDDLKLRSCMTLFQLAAPEEPVVGKVLEKYFGGRPDERTIAIIKEQRMIG